MDYSNASSEIIESLEFLRPPVKRIPDKTWKGTNSIIDIHKSEIGKVHKYIPKTKEVTSSKDKVPVNFSTCLIEKKSLERQIFGKYSILSYTTLLHPTYRKDNLHKCSNKDKPLIKVTVIPKTQQTQTGRLHRKLRHNTKSVQRTASNYENSIQPKKLFLIVTGDKEKIYEIKPSESAALSCGQIESKFIAGKNVVKSIANIKELIKSLDMDRKKNKTKKKKINTNQNFKMDEIAENSKMFKECLCKEFSMFGVDGNTNARASRLRISGRVGLTENEKYVLNCTATVDNTPIPTISKRIENSSSQFFMNNDIQPKYREQFNIGGCEAGRNKTTTNEIRYDQNYKKWDYNGCNNVNTFEKQRDSNIQVDFENFTNSENVNRNVLKSKKSQSTQVDLNIQLPNNTLRTQDKDETNHCNCNHSDNIVSVLGKEAEGNALRAYHSPLVIISVYPKQETPENTKVQKKSVMENLWRSQGAGKYVSDGNSKRPEKRQMNIKRNEVSPRRSRSPSPLKNDYCQKNKNYNQNETRTGQTTRRQGSPPYNLNGVRNNTTQNKGKIKEPTKRDNSTVQNQECMNRATKSQEPKNVQSQFKKTLVEDYTKMLTGNMNRNFNNNKSKNENSKVNIKIDGDNDNYDLLFNQGKFNTDLRIRKTVKETGSQKYEEDGRKTRKDFSALSNTGQNRRKGSPVKQISQSNAVLDLQNNTSTLNPRDSIEIFHRRETTHRIKNIGTRQPANESDFNENNTNCCAPVKHYRGDDCELPNPVERDKQIRELLGILKGTPTTSEQEHTFGSISEDHSMIQCFYKKTCTKNFETGVSMYNLYSCRCVHDINENEKRNRGNKNGYSRKNAGNEPSLEETSLYQQLILNRNIQIFLQVEQFTKQKPIVLTKKQYNKVKKIIQKTISKRVGLDKHKNSIISVGEVRKRKKSAGPVECRCAKFTQTKGSITISKNIKEDEKKDSICKQRKCFEQSQLQTVVLFDSKKAEHSNMDAGNKIVNSKNQTISPLEIRYTNVGYMKSDTFSSTNVESLSSTSFNQRNNSIYTIFKGYRKTPTPNLGTSIFSSLTSSTKLKTKYFESSSSTPDIKTKKPFLRRLMSCLVMPSRISEKKIPTNPTRKAPSINSSVDSYHINTSLGVIEMTSSVYDTTASFYSNHAVGPVVSNKIKRGFFSSVRGFLTSR